LFRPNAARLPFADGTFAAVISNHSLEHFDDLAGALSEVGRVIAPHGALFAAVPDASALTDKLYRWLARGGGHVNVFTSAKETAATIESAAGPAARGHKTALLLAFVFKSPQRPGPGAATSPVAGRRLRTVAVSLRLAVQTA
jgi:SAM-dependent methyltransferase